MNPRNFCYMLQGRFELSSDDLTLEQLGQVKAELKRVLQDKTVTWQGPMIDYCRWLEGVLEFHPAGEPLPFAKHEAVKNRLNAIFEHVVDQSGGHSVTRNPGQAPGPRATEFARERLC